MHHHQKPYSIRMLCVRLTIRRIGVELFNNIFDKNAHVSVTCYFLNFPTLSRKIEVISVRVVFYKWMMCKLIVMLMIGWTTVCIFAFLILFNQRNFSFIFWLGLEPYIFCLLKKICLHQRSFELELFYIGTTTIDSSNWFFFSVITRANWLSYPRIANIFWCCCHYFTRACCSSVLWLDLQINCTICNITNRKYHTGIFGFIALAMNWEGLRRCKIFWDLKQKASQFNANSNTD